MSPLLFGWNVALVFGLMTALWVVSVRLRDASIVDPWWSIAFLLVTVHTALRTGMTPAKVLLVILVGTWSLRLWLHLLLRNHGRPEDPRYASFRRRYGPNRYWPVSLVRVTVRRGGQHAADLQNDLNALLVLRLVREPDVFVLERENLARLDEERHWAGVTSEFWTGGHLLDGGIEQDLVKPDELTVVLACARHRVARATRMSP